MVWWVPMDLDFLMCAACYKAGIDADIEALRLVQEET